MFRFLSQSTNHCRTQIKINCIQSHITNFDSKRENIQRHIALAHNIFDEKNLKNNFQFPFYYVHYYFFVRSFSVNVTKTVYSITSADQCKTVQTGPRPADADGSQFNEFINLKITRKKDFKNMDSISVKSRF